MMGGRMFEYILGFFQNVRFVDIVDIGVIAVFLYLILVWFKKARVRFILVGMIIIGPIYILARIFELYLTTIIFQAFFAVLLIMIVVIFQDDFRHFFERIAIWGITRKRSRTIPFSQGIDILNSGLANLSRKKIGVLVVIRGQDPLERHLEAGIHLDGVLSQVLLESIFEPHTPSHDGAVVIDGMRLTMFGCYLPLSTNMQEVGRLGTRHAAALGLAERTDALCIVVSEEQGTISAAEEGRIKQLSQITELQGILEKFYSRRFPKKKKTSLLNFLTGHFIEKIIAVVLACGLWLGFGHRIEIIRRDFVVPIEYRNLEPDRIIGEPKTKEITITLSGSERTFRLLDPKELKLSLNMAEIKDGENKFHLTKELIRRPDGLSLVNIDPEELQLKVYKMVSLSIPVKINTFARLPAGVVLKEIKVEPKNVAIMVPNIIDQEEITISTEPVELKSITETTELIPKLIIAPDIRFPDDKVPEVKVTIEVEKKDGR